MEYAENQKKYDPRMHSAEHILNQTMDRMFKRGRSTNAHIEKKKSRLDYSMDRDLTEEEINQIEAKVNEIIDLDLPVIEELLPFDEANEKYNLNRIPDNPGEVVRIIKIGDYDTCPCSGPHVKSTKEIGRFKLYSSSYDNGRLRIRYKLPKEE